MQQQHPHWHNRLASLAWVVVTILLAILAITVGLILLGFTLAISLTVLLISALLMPFSSIRSRRLPR